MACLIKFAIGLRARSANRRAFASVQHPELDTGSIRRPAHDPVKCVDFAHEVPFAQDRQSLDCTT